MKNFVRITSGRLRGRKLETPGGKTHPMGERERLALFNMISDYLPRTTVLDAFAGSGALGIEALSRGASEVVFVESNREAAQCIRRNLVSLGFEATSRGDVDPVRFSKTELATEGILDTDNFRDAFGSTLGAARVICSKVQSFQTKQQFDLVLADPPYDAFRLPEIEHLAEFVRDNGILVLSHPGLAPDLPGMMPEKSRKYAGATISIYTKKV